jgi:hypothetical protein
VKFLKYQEFSSGTADVPKRNSSPVRTLANNIDCVMLNKWRKQSGNYI